MTKRIFIILLLHAINSEIGFAQLPGELDISFGNEGIITFGEASTRNNQGRSLALTEDGNIVVVGRVYGASGQDNDVIIAKVLTDGQLHSAFGDDGISVIDLGGTSDIGQDVLPDETGNLLVAAGNNASGSFESTLLSIDPLGNLDSDFGEGGIVNLSVDGTSSGLFKIIGDNSGGFIGGGTIYSPESLFYIVRFDADGNLDEQFGNIGYQTVSVAPFHNVISGLVVHETGKITATSSGFDFIGQTEYRYGQVWQLNSDGSSDTDFNGSGQLDIELSDSFTGVSGLHRYDDGRLLIVGNAEVEGGFKMFALKLQADGTYDSDFGVGGVAWFENTTELSFGASAFVLQPDGKVIIGGFALNDINRDFFVMRIDGNGTLDQTFGDNGIVVTEVSTEFDAIADMALQVDGKLVVAGTARVGLKDEMALARYHTGLNISVLEFEAERQLMIFPNPVTDIFNVRSESELKHLELLDALGRSVLTRTVSAAEVQLDLSALPAGIYLLRASDGTYIFNKRVVRE